MPTVSSFTQCLCMVCVVLCLAACGGQQKDLDPAAPGAQPAAKTSSGEDHDHGDEIVIGEASIADWQAKPHRFGPIIPGGDLAAGVDLTPVDPQPTAVRIWVGTEDGKGSIKTKTDPESHHPGGWHGHIAVPDPVPAGSQFWVELETASGSVTKGFAIEVEAKAAGGHDHGHGDHSH